MAAHQRLLGGVERAGLGEDLGQDRHLADVVELGGAGDVLAAAAVEPDDVGDGGGEVGHLAGMGGAAGSSLASAFSRTSTAVRPRPSPMRIRAIVTTREGSRLERHTL